MADKTWFLDVDGVLNPVGVKPPTNIWKTWIEKTVTDRETRRPWPVKISTDVIAFVNEMHARDDVEIIWHTTWQESAIDISESFGLPKFPILYAPEFRAWNHRHSSQGWWKMPAVEKFLASTDRDVLWTDDDLIVVSPLPEPYVDLRLKVIAPHQETGLTPKHLKHIREFLEGR